MPVSNNRFYSKYMNDDFGFGGRGTNTAKETQFRRAQAQKTRLNMDLQMKTKDFEISEIESIRIVDDFQD